MKLLEITKIVIIATLPICMVSCDEEEDDELLGNWTELSDFEGVPRSDAVGFSVSTKGYVGLGYDGEDRLTDFWEYDAEKNTWMQKADFLGVARSGAVGFGTDTKGYLGTGYDGKNKLNDFWEYDPQNNTWTQKADFGGSARYGAVAFSINNMGYIGTGYDGFYLKDFWQYDPQNNTWTQKVSLGGSKRRDAVGFVIGGKGYVCTGLDNGSYEDDFWEYDPALDSWTKKRSISNATSESFDDDYASITGSSKVVFVSGYRAFLVGGSGSISSTVWEYDQTTDLWEEKTGFEGTARIEAVAFSVNEKGFITTGRSSSYYFDDIWTFDPDVEYNEYD